jgi:hypothetical protein
MRITVKELERTFSGFKPDLASPLFESIPGYRVIGTLGKQTVHCHSYSRVEDGDANITQEPIRALPYVQVSDSQSNNPLSQIKSQPAQEDPIIVGIYA